MYFPTHFTYCVIPTLFGLDQHAVLSCSISGATYPPLFSLLFWITSILNFEPNLYYFLWATLTFHWMLKMTFIVIHLYVFLKTRDLRLLTMNMLWILTSFFLVYATHKRVILLCTTIALKVFWVWLLLLSTRLWLITVLYFCSLVVGHIEENSCSIPLCSGGWFNTNCLLEYSYRKCWRGYAGIEYTVVNYLQETLHFSCMF